MKIIFIFEDSDDHLSSEELGKKYWRRMPCWFFPIWSENFMEWLSPRASVDLQSTSFNIWDMLTSYYMCRSDHSNIQSYQKHCQKRPLLPFFNCHNFMKVCFCFSIQNHDNFFMGCWYAINVSAKKFEIY